MAEAAQAVASAITLVAALVSPQPVTLTYYGTAGDGYLGQHHAAYWHGLDCGLPVRVDKEHFGAAAPASVAFCSQIVVCYQARCVLVTVIDRQRDDTLFGLPHLDLWPAAAAALGMIEKGIVEGKAYGLQD